MTNKKVLLKKMFILENSVQYSCEIIWNKYVKFSLNQSVYQGREDYPGGFIELRRVSFEFFVNCQHWQCWQYMSFLCISVGMIILCIFDILDFR